MNDQGQSGLGPDERVAALKVEFARLRERQDYLDRMLQGHPDTWAGLQHMIPSGTELVIDKAVGEARQGALAMATVAKTLAALEGEAPAVPVEDPLQKIRDAREARKKARGAIVGA